MLAAEDYARIKGQLDFTRRLDVTLVMIAVDWVLVGASLWMATSGSPLLFVLSQVLLSVVFFHNFALVHEAGHGNISSHHWVNDLVGYYASIGCFTAYKPWKFLHQEHHKWAGTTRDPAAANVKRWREAGRVPGLVRFSWRSWVPMTAFMQHVVFWSYPLTLMRQRRDLFWACLPSTLLLPAAYVAFYLAAPQLFTPAQFGMAFVFYLFVEELVNLPHHIDLLRFEERLPLRLQHQATRSCHYPWGLSESLVCNFNFHTEHHLFPGLPWYRLRRARALVKPALGDGYHESTGVAWNLAHRANSIDAIIL